MLTNKANTKKGGRYQVWLAGRGTSTDETKPCALPTRADLETDADGSVSKNATATAIAATWLYSGVQLEDTLKYSGKASVEKLSGGIPIQVGIPMAGEVESVEYTVAKFQALNALLDDTAVDIILKKENSAEAYYIRNVGITVEPDNKFSDSKVNTMKLTWAHTLQTYNIGALVTTGFPASYYDVYLGDLDA